METHFLQDLAIVMAAAGVMTLICHRLRQPVVIGYLLAGLLVGPYTPPFSLVSNLESIHTMAELGLVFLLFCLGLEFNLPKIQKVGPSAGLAAVLEVTGMLVIGYLLGRSFGWSRSDSVFLGAILCISSTTIIVKVFMDFKMIEEKFVQVVFGILILEDVVAVAILSILSGLGPQGGPQPGLILGSFLRIGLFVTLFLVLGLLLIPRFIHWVARFGVKEVLGIVTLGLCLGGSVLASSFHLSVALGAFLTGAVLAASKEINQIEDWIHPVRDMFSAIFFVSAGMLIQPELLWKYKIEIVLVSLVTLAGKILSGAVGSFIAGYDLKTSARVGMSMAQIGEFSFVIASLGLTLKVTSEFLYPLAIMVSSITTLATPYLIQNSDHMIDTLLGIIPSSIRSQLDRYQSSREHSRQLKGSGHGTAVLSKYLVRMGVYLALLLGIILLMPILSVSLENPPIVAGLWATMGILCLPLFKAVSKYGNHLVLLSVIRNKWVLERLNVHLFYRVCNGITMILLGLTYLIVAQQVLLQTNVVIGIGVVMALVEFLFWRKVLMIEERLESILDQVIGLATSEPTRQAVLQSGEKTLMLFDLTDQVTLPLDSHASFKTIRALGLREKAGASIVAIYREGKHLANPHPETELRPHDVLVLLGTREEMAKAKQLLFQP